MTLLTPDDIRGFVDTGLSDESLQLLLDAAEAEIVRYAGPSDSAVEWFSGGQQVIALARPADSIASIVEHGAWPTEQTTLDATDYEIDPTGYLVYRRVGGVNGRYTWWGRVVVSYVPVRASRPTSSA
jgi:hypothetical protein